MKATALVSRLVDRTAEVLPKLTSGLWKVGVLGAAFFGLCAFAETAGIQGWYLVFELLEPFQDIVDDGALIGWLLVGMSCLSALYVKAWKRNWRGAEWLSLGAWVCLFTAMNFVAMAVESHFSLIRSFLFFDAFDIPSFPESVFESLWRLCQSLASLRWFVIVSAFAMILSAHRRRIGSSDEGMHFPIGGRWMALTAIAFGTVFAALLEQFPPISIVTMFVHGDVGILEPILAFGSNWIDFAIVFGSVFAVYAWKTGAILSFQEDSIKVSLASGGFGLFRIKWSRIIGVTEIMFRGRCETLVIEHGRLPWFRTTFSLHRNRDGDGPIARMRSETLARNFPIRTTSLRRATTVAGILSIALMIGFAASMHAITVQSIEKMAVAETLPDVFPQQGHFLLLGSLTAASGLALGVGLGLLFSKSHGCVRPLPALGAGVAAGFLPTPLIYWLVYIAIYAIINARLGPLMLIPHVPFPEESVVDAGFWLGSSAALFAVVGYVLALMIAVKPWYWALPSFPYRLPQRARNIAKASAKDA